MTAKREKHTAIVIGRIGWEWDPVWQCYRNGRKKIYPHNDGTFTISQNCVWIDGFFETFEDAVKEFRRPTSQ